MDTWAAVLRLDEATQQQPFCSEKVRVILGEGVDDEPVGRAPVLGRPMHSRWCVGAADGPVDADAVVCTRSTAGGRLNPDPRVGTSNA